MSAAARQAEYRVSWSNVFAIDNLCLLHGSDCESRKIIFSWWIHARHFGGLASNESTPCLLATCGNALDDLRGDCNIKFPAGEVVQKEQRFRTLHENIIYAHGDQIDADRIMPVQLECQFQLRAHAVGAGHQYRLAIFLRNFE